MKILKINKKKLCLPVKFLEPNSKMLIMPEVTSLGYNREKMTTFCYAGSEKDIGQMLKTVILNIDIDEDDFTCYYGGTPEEVIEAHDNSKSIFSFNLFTTSNKRNVKLNPFNTTCIGVAASSQYIVSLQQIRVDITKFGLLLGGIIVFFLARKLSHNAAFFYLCGILLGVFASILVLIWFISKLIPKVNNLTLICINK